MNNWEFTPKWNILTLKSFQIFDSLEDRVRKNVKKKLSLLFVHAVNINGIQCCFGPYWLALYTLKKIHSEIASKSDK